MWALLGQGPHGLPAAALLRQPAMQQKRPRKPQGAEHSQERPRGSSKSRKTRVVGKGGAQKASRNAAFRAKRDQKTSRNAVFCDISLHKTSRNATFEERAWQ